jgi:hypothetical protein
MQAAYHSDSTGGASETSEVPLGEATGVGFTITAQDTHILQQYLEEFQQGDKSARTQLVNRTMGELCGLHPVHAPFDKLDAKRVCNLYTNILSA